jgi:hypothetical protein
MTLAETETSATHAFVAGLVVHDFGAKGVKAFANSRNVAFRLCIKMGVRCRRYVAGMKSRGV